MLLATIVGLAVSALKIKYSVKYTYRCKKCDISFFWAHSFRKHLKLIHGPEPIMQTRVLILGGGFAGIEVLKKLQRAFRDDVEIDITMVSKNNFFLFTPMLHEVSSGMIDTRHIATPVRKFCTRAKFYEAGVESIDLKNRQVTIVHDVGKEWQPSTRRHTLNYDYLVMALGSETKFANLPGVSENAITLKDLDDAITLRNHVINMLEQAELEHQNPELKNRLMTFVVAGGGFSGVEIVGELNDFVRSSIKDLYRNIEGSEIRVVLAASGDRLLPELGRELGDFALQQLQKSGVQVMLNSRVKEATEGRVVLEDGSIIPSHTLIRAAGVGPEKLVAELLCEHDKRGRIVVNDSLEVRGLEHVYAVGDCASILDGAGNLVCPATAQHAIREGKVAANNIIAAIRVMQRTIDSTTRPGA